MAARPRKIDPFRHLYTDLAHVPAQTPPSAQVLKDRLVGRGTETAEVIDSRMKRAVEESQGVEKYDYLVINDDLERCAKEMHSIIQGEHDRVSRNADFIDDIRKELKEL